MKNGLTRFVTYFMQHFSKAQFKQAIQLLKQNSVLEPDKIDTLEMTIGKSITKYLSGLW